MVYKRYIKKNGKLYGPYYQSSKKENGKVITKYVGKKDLKKGSVKRNSLKLVLGIALFFVVLAGVFLIVNGNINFTGKITSEDGSSNAEGISDSVSEENIPVVSNEEEISGGSDVESQETNSEEIVEEEIDSSEENEVNSEEGNETTVPEENNEIVVPENETSEEEINETEEYEEPEVIEEMNESEEYEINESQENEEINESGEYEETNETIEEINESEEDGGYSVSNESINESKIYDINVTEEINETIETNFSLVNETVNETVIIDGNISIQIDTTQYGAVVGMPVKWKKKITAENMTNISVELPKEAENIIVYKISNEITNETINSEDGSLNNSEVSNVSEVSRENVSSFSITGNVVREDYGGGGLGIVNFFRNLFNKIWGAITGRVIDINENADSIEVNIDENATEYEIEYETPAPVATEENISRGKRVVISSEVHYENILAYSELTKETPLDRVKLYYYDDVSGERVSASFDAYDYNGDLINGNTPEEKGYENVSVDDLFNVSESIENNGLVSFITWVVPHTSNQTYEIIIEISNAEHLDLNRSLIENIYDKVKAKDDIWSPVINNSEYVRVTFGENLTYENDITVYARSLNENETGSIEIYRENENESISLIENISSEGFYKTYLTNLSVNESIGIFDLKMIGNIEFDYIVDPIYLNVSTNATGTNVTTESSRFTHLNLTDDLVLYMPFDVPDGNATWVDGNNSGALSFDGVDDYVLTPTDFNGSQTNLTYTVWIKPSSVQQNIFSHILNGNNYQNRFVIYNDCDIGFVSAGAGASGQRSSLQCNFGEWNFVAVTAFNSGAGYNVTFYVNGNSESLLEADPYPLGAYSSLYIGKWDVADYAFNGSIDEVRIFNRTLNQSEITSLYNHVVLNSTDLVGEWLLDEPEGLTALDTSGNSNDGDCQGYGDDTRYTYDYSSNDNDGTIEGAMYWNRSLGYYGSAYEFDGVDDYVGNLNLNSNPENFTICSWVKPFSLAGSSYRSIFNLGYAGGNRGMDLFILNTGVIKQYVRGEGLNGFVSSVGTVNFGNWNFVCSIFDNSTLDISIYINGINQTLTGDITNHLEYADSSAEIGARGGILLFNGSIDEVMIFNRSLSTSEIEQIYNSTYSRFYPTGEMLFENLNFGTNNTVNISIPNCQQYNGSSLQGKINDGNYQNFSSCSLSNYAVNGNLTSANLTIKFLSAPYNFYSPLLVGNILNTTNDIVLDDSYTDRTAPTITYETPTPSNSSYTKNSATIIANISDNSAGNTSSFIDFDNSLVGYWMMGDYYNSTGIFDNSSYDNFGSFNGDNFGASNISQGKRGNGLNFDGVDDYVDVGSSSSLDILANEDFSISFWMKTSYVSNKVLIGKYGLTNPRWQIYQVVPGGSQKVRAYFVYSDASTSSIDTDSGLYDGIYHHFVFVWDRNVGAYWYVDGSLNTSEETTEWTDKAAEDLSNSENLFFGKSSVAATNFNGSIDEVIIFNRSLSQGEINALYNSQVNKFNATFSNLAEGQHNYTLWAVDEAGNFNTSTRNFIVDNTFPTISFENPTPANNSYTKNSVTIKANITDDSGQNSSSWIDFDNSLVGYWMMGDYYNSTGIFDNSSYDNFGSFNGGLETGNISDGIRGDGLSFDGSDDYVDCGNDESLNITEEITVGAWVNLRQADTFDWIVASSSSASAVDGFMLFKYNKNLRFSINSYNANSAYFTFPDFDQWIFVVGTYDKNAVSNQINIYVNGVKGTSDSYTSDIAYPTNWRVDIGFLKNSYQWNGSIDEVMIFNRSLSQSEISALYDSKANKFNASFSSLSSGQHNYSVYAIDEAGNLNVSDLRNFIVDATFPQIEFTTGTEDNASYLSQDYIYVNVSITEANRDAIIFYLYNSTLDLINSTLYTSITNEINFTGLEDGTYYYNVSVNDSANNLNSTETRTIILDTTPPQVTIALPVSGQIFTTSTATFQVTTDENSTCNYSLDSFATNTSMTPDSNGTIHSATATLSNGNYIANYYCSDIFGNANNTKNVSFSVSIATGGTGDTGGSSGGSSTAPSPVDEIVVIDINSIERTLALNRIELGQISIENTGTTSRTFFVSVEVLNSIISFEESSIEIGPKDSGEFEFRITPPSKTGIYTGKIIITSTGFRKEIPVTLNIKTEKSLFDIIITIPKSMKDLSLGKNLEAQIDLLQMGIKEKMDVTLNYVIKDFSGKVYVVESETIAVTDQKTLQKEFHTENLPAGEYILGTELIYPNGVAIASSQFKIKGKIPLGERKILLYSLITAFLVVFIIVFLIIRSYKKILRKGSNK